MEIVSNTEICLNTYDLPVPRLPTTKNKSEVNKEWRDKHREYIKTYKHNLWLRQKMINPSFERLRGYKRGAKRRGFAWDLDDDIAIALFTFKCKYCGAPPNPLNGIDRINSNKDYTFDNVLTCCFPCNRGKSNMTIEDWINYLDRVARRRNDINAQISYRPGKYLYFVSTAIY